MKFEDNPSPYLTLLESAAPGTPASTLGKIYLKTDGKFYTKNDAGTEVDLSAAGSGNVATDTIWDAAGDLVQGTGANTGAKLAAGTAGMFLKSAGAAAANLWAFPPGTELDHVGYTSAVAISATSEATANTIVTGSAVAYDGSTVVMIYFQAPGFNTPTDAAGRNMVVCLYDGASSIGFIGQFSTVAAAAQISPIRCEARLTPSAATHTYSIRAYVTGGGGSVYGGSGGAAAYHPGYIRITKV